MLASISGVARVLAVAPHAVWVWERGARNAVAAIVALVLAAKLWIATADTGLRSWRVWRAWFWLWLRWLWLRLRVWRSWWRRRRFWWAWFWLWLRWLRLWLRLRWARVWLWARLQL